VDNGTEFTARATDAWARAHGVELRFSRPGTPTDNPFIESFNDKFRDECLNRHWFGGLADARFTIEDWRIDHNLNRPHGPLGNLPLRVRGASFSGPPVGSASLRPAEARGTRDASTLGFVGPENGGRPAATSSGKTLTEGGREREGAGPPPAH